MGKISNKFFKYKGKPLVRCGNTIYYGSMADEYVIMLQILNTITLPNGEKGAGTVVVQLMRTAENLKPQDIIVKKSEKETLYAALEIADIWLERALSEQ